MNADWIFSASLGVLILAVVLATTHWIKRAAKLLVPTEPPPKPKETSVLEIHITRGKVVLWFEDPFNDAACAELQEKFGGPEACVVVTGYPQPDGIIVLKKDRQ